MEETECVQNAYENQVFGTVTTTVEVFIPAKCLFISGIRRCFRFS
jgi:hypothetical protein